MVYSVKKRDVQCFAALRNCPNASSSLLENCQVSELLWPAYAGTWHCPHEARTFGGWWGFLMCGSALFPKCQIRTGTLFWAQVSHLEPEAAEVDGWASRLPPKGLCPRL